MFDSSAIAAVRKLPKFSAGELFVFGKVVISGGGGAVRKLERPRALALLYNQRVV